MRLRQVALAVGAGGLLVASAWGLLLAVAVAHADASPAERDLAQAGYKVERGAASALVGLADSAPQAIVLRGPPQLAAAELEALRGYVRGGGDLWVLSDEPQLALWPSLRDGIGTYPGFIYAEDGREPVLTAGPARKAVSIDGAKALRIEGIEYARIVTADARSFRDSDGDGKLETGEPSGPFTVGASLVEGEGRVVVVAVHPGADAALPLSELAPGKVGRAVVLDYASHDAWTLPPRALLTALALPAASALAAACAAALALALVLMAFGEASAPRSRSAGLAEETRGHLASRLRAKDPAHPFLDLLEETP